jgi:cysteinyl-tRNA synthetase
MIPNLVLYDSKSKKSISLLDKKSLINTYSCGPTIYNYCHIGNLRSFLFVDVLRKSLKTLGYNVNMAMNLTDVDDKIITKSQENNQTIFEFTKIWEKAFFNDLEILFIEQLEHYPKATDSIKEMEEIIEKLFDNGIAYEKDDSIYFSLKEYKNYGVLYKIDPSQLKAGTRYDADEYEKEDVRDFALWKNSKDPKEMSWKIKRGEGRPGWHLECSAMIRKIFHSGVDIHTGGIDLLFPHHENEIAQSCGAYPNENFVKIWLHCEHLLVDNQKMSKSKNNYFILNDLLDKGYNPSEIRFVLINTHYRSKLNFTFTRLEESRTIIQKFHRIDEQLKNIDSNLNITNQFQSDVLEKLRIGILDSLSNDLDFPKTISLFLELYKDMNQIIAQRKEEVFLRELKIIMNFYQDFLHFRESTNDNLNIDSTWVESMIEKRDLAKKNKDYKLSDQIRDELKSKGILLEDTKEGITRWKTM